MNKILTAYLVFVPTFTTLISRTGSLPVPPPPPELIKSCDKIKETAKVTFFNDENFEGCSPVIETLSNGCEHNLGNNTYSSMLVEEPTETENICLIFFPTEDCVGSNYWIVKNQTNVTRFGSFNDILRCFRICNEKERERNSKLDAMETISSTEKTIPTWSSTSGQITPDAPVSSISKSSNRRQRVNIEGKSISLRFYHPEGYKDLLGRIFNIKFDSCVNLDKYKFSTVFVISPKPACLELFIDSQCKSKQKLIVKDNTSVLRSLHENIKSLRFCPTKG